MAAWYLAEQLPSIDPFHELTFMLSLRLFLMILCTFLCREVCWPLDRLYAAKPLLCMALICLSFGLIARIACSMFQRRPATNGELYAGWQSSIQRLEWFWAACLPLILMMSDWGPWLKLLEARALPQSILLVLWFLPTLAALFLLDVTTSHLEFYLETRSTRAADTIPFDVRQRRRSGVRLFAELLSTRLRLGAIFSVLACLTPVMFIALVVDGLNSLPWLAHVEQTIDSRDAIAVAAPRWLLSIASCIVGLAAVGFFLPRMLSRWMGVVRLTGEELRSRIEGYCKAVGVRVEPMWVASRNRWTGAAVVGWMPGRQQLWLGDGLVHQLTEEEVDMVVMHELAHIRRNHFLMRLAPIAIASLLGGSLWCLAQGLLAEVLTEQTATIIAHGIGFASSAVALLVGLSVASRVCELDADRHACFLGANNCGWADGQVPVAARKLRSALEKLHPADQHHAATWLHPSLRQRVLSLSRLGG